MVDKLLKYAAVQNGVILGIYDTKSEAEVRVQDEIKHDWLSILMKKKFRKIFKKCGEIALHTYQVISILEVTDIK